MFGVTVASIGTLTAEEKARYKAFYCGLCKTLKERYGQASTIMLSYELAFLIVLLSSLYEPEESTGSMICPAHPIKPIPYITTRFSDYAADLSVVLSYHKCLDDQADEKSITGFWGSMLLKKAYRQASARIPEHTYVIENALATIRSLEHASTPPDATSKAFGEMLGFIFESIPGTSSDVFSDTLGNFGRNLGQFILLMDAAIDMDKDDKSGSYNPFLCLADRPHPNDLRLMLSSPISNAAAEFERLPLVQDANILNSIIYQGVWQKFNEKYSEEDMRISKADGMDIMDGAYKADSTYRTYGADVTDRGYETGKTVRANKGNKEISASFDTSTSHDAPAPRKGKRRNPHRNKCHKDYIKIG